MLRHLAPTISRSNGVSCEGDQCFPPKTRYACATKFVGLKCISIFFKFNLKTINSSFILSLRPLYSPRRAARWQLPIGAPGILGLGNPQPGKSFLGSWITFIHFQQAFVAGDQCPRGAYKLLRVHLGLLHFQFRISGMSWPYLSMYCLCSMSLSCAICFR